MRSVLFTTLMSLWLASAALACDPARAVCNYASSDEEIYRRSAVMQTLTIRRNQLDLDRNEVLQRNLSERFWYSVICQALVVPDNNNYGAGFNLAACMPETCLRLHPKQELFFLRDIGLSRRVGAGEPIYWLESPSHYQCDRAYWQSRRTRYFP